MRYVLLCAIITVSGCGGEREPTPSRQVRAATPVVSGPVAVPWVAKALSVGEEAATLHVSQGSGLQYVLIFRKGRAKNADRVVEINDDHIVLRGRGYKEIVPIHAIAYVEREECARAVDGPAPTNFMAVFRKGMKVWIPTREQIEYNEQVKLWQYIEPPWRVYVSRETEHNSHSGRRITWPDRGTV